MIIKNEEVDGFKETGIFLFKFYIPVQLSLCHYYY